MNCYFHYERPAVAKCEQCGRFLCPECTSNTPVVLCRNCFDIFVTEEKEKQKSHIRTSVIVFMCTMLIFVGLNITNDKSMLYGIMGMIIQAIFMAGIPYGWRKMSGSKFKGILILPIIGWIIYFTVKLQIAYWIGWIFFIKDIISYVKSKKSNY